MSNPFVPLLNSLRQTNPIQSACIFIVLSTHVLSPLDNHWLTHNRSTSRPRLEAFVTGLLFVLVENAWLFAFSLSTSSVAIYIAVVVLHATSLLTYPESVRQNPRGFQYYATMTTSAGLNTCLLYFTSELPDFVKGQSREIDAFLPPIYGFLVLVVYVALKGITREAVVGDQDDLPGTSRPFRVRIMWGAVLVAQRIAMATMLRQFCFIIVLSSTGTLSVASHGPLHRSQMVMERTSFGLMVDSLETLRVILDVLQVNLPVPK